MQQSPWLECATTRTLIDIYCLIETPSHDNITKTRLFKYIENFTTKNWKFSDKNSDIFFIFLLKI